MILQDYQTEISNEHIILGNEAIFKCSIPSFVSDFVTIKAWVDNEANSFELNTLNGKCSILLHRFCRKKLMYIICSVEDSFWISWNAHFTDKLITINDNDHLVGEKFLATQRLTWHSPAQESVTVAIQRLAPVIFQSSTGVILV